MHYAKSKVSKKALDYLLLYLKVIKARNKLVTITNIVDFLEGIFINLY
jgi:hypothetical protein